MDFVVTNTYLGDILHRISQALLAPDIILLIAFILYAIWCVGGLLIEVFTERRNFKVNMPRFLADLMAARQDGIPAVIRDSALLNRQKVALLTVYDYRMLPGDAMIALIRRLVSEEESRYDRIEGRNSTAAKIAPMLGLMGTLIPLGPGIAALGSNDAEMLSNSLLLAFDTTIAGLVVAAVCLAVAKIRGNWYANYMSALDSAMATMLQKIEIMRAEGAIEIVEPTDFAFIYQSSLKGKAAKPREIDVEELMNEAAAQAPAAAGAAVEAAVEAPQLDSVPLEQAAEPLELAAEAEQAAEPIVSDAATQTAGEDGADV